MSQLPLSIITEDSEFCMELMMNGIIIYADTHTPSDKELNECPHILLTSAHPWVPHTVSFPRTRMLLEDVINNGHTVSALSLIHI